MVSSVSFWINDFELALTGIGRLRNIRFRTCVARAAPQLLNYHNQPQLCCQISPQSSRVYFSQCLSECSLSLDKALEVESTAGSTSIAVRTHLWFRNALCFG